MKKPLLLHALSLKDRMLEPNSLPLHGRVWGYAKDECSRDAFIGHCLTMLSLSGMRASDISLGKKDIVAFDARGRDGVYTIVISLADDSLASGYFYFLGIWNHPDHLTPAAPLPTPPADSDLLGADFQYEVFFGDGPMQRSDYGKFISGEIFSELLYDGEFCLAGNALPGREETAHFLIAPTQGARNLVRPEVRHVLYSLRNMMALTAACMRLYDRIWHAQDEVELYKSAMSLMRKARMKQVRAQEWDGLVRENGEALLRASEVSIIRTRQNSEVRNFDALFDSIVSELNSAGMPGMQPIWPRLRAPFAHTLALLNERNAMLKRSTRQCEVLLSLLHSRMLASQQALLDGLLQAKKETCPSDG